MSTRPSLKAKSLPKTGRRPRALIFSLVTLMSIIKVMRLPLILIICLQLVFGSSVPVFAGVTTCEIVARQKMAKNFLTNLDPRNLRAYLPSKINFREVNSLIEKHPLGTPETDAWLEDVRSRLTSRPVWKRPFSVKRDVSAEEAMAYGAVLSPENYRPALKLAEEKNLVKYARREIQDPIMDGIGNALGTALKKVPLVKRLVFWSTSSNPVTSRGLLDVGGLLKVMRYPTKVQDADTFLINHLQALGPKPPGLLSPMTGGDQFWNIFKYRQNWLDAKAVYAQNRPKILSFYADLLELSKTPRTPKEVAAFLKKNDLDADLKQLKAAGFFENNSTEEVIAKLRSQNPSVKVDWYLTSLVKATLFRALFIPVVVYAAVKKQPESLGQWSALLTNLFPKTLFVPFIEATYVSGIYDLLNLSPDNKLGFSQEAFDYFMNGWVGGVGEIRCFYQDHVNCETQSKKYEASEEYLKLKRDGLISLIDYSKIIAKDGFDPYAPGMLNFTGRSDPVCFPCDPDGKIFALYKRALNEFQKTSGGSEEEFRRKFFDTMGNSRTKNMLNPYYIEPSCKLKMGELFVESHPSEAAGIPPKTKLQLQEEESCKVKYQMGK